MKQLIKILAIPFFLMCFVYPVDLFSQEPPPPPGGHGSNTNEGPSGAPIDGGLGILLALGASYGACKLYKIRKKKSGEEEPE